MIKIMFHLNCLEQGGAERVVTNLSGQFAKDGYEVVIATEFHGQNEFALEKGVRRVHAGLNDIEEASRGYLQRALNYARRIRNLRRVIRQEKPDVVIAFAHKANYRAIMATVGIKLPVIISVRTNPIGEYDFLSDKIMLPIFFPMAAGCVFQTPSQKEFFPKGIQNKSRIILNPIHDSYIGRKTPEYRTKKIVQVGRIVHFKGQAMLIQAFAKVYKRYPEYTLHIYGGDSCDGTMEKLLTTCKECGVEESVFLEGACSKIPETIEDAAFFAFTSDWEGMPNTLLEAMALAMPVVATDCPCGGPATVVRDKVNGLLIPIKQQVALEEAMIYLIEHPKEAEAMGREAKKLGQEANAYAIYLQWKDYIESVRA